MEWTKKTQESLHLGKDLDEGCRNCWNAGISSDGGNYKNSVLEDCGVCKETDEQIGINKPDVYACTKRHFWKKRLFLNHNNIQ